jgi:hypothetical protein
MGKKLFYDYNIVVVEFIDEASYIQPYSDNPPNDSPPYSYKLQSADTTICPNSLFPF